MIDGAALGGQYVAIAELSDAEWANTKRVAYSDQLIFGHDYQRVSALQASHGVRRTLFPGGTGRFCVHFGDDFRVRSAGKRGAPLFEFRAQGSGVDHVAIVAHRDRQPVVAVGDYWLCVGSFGRSGRGVSGVADGDMAGQPFKVLFTECLCDQAHRGVKEHVPAVRRSDAGRLLPAVLQGEETKISDIGDILARRIYADDTTGFTGPVVVKPVGPRGVRQLTLRCAAPVAPPRLRWAGNRVADSYPMVPPSRFHPIAPFCTFSHAVSSNVP